MKLDIATEYTGQPGYEKFILRFHSPKNKSEAKLIKALSFDPPVYIAGAEPKFSVFVGIKKEEPVIDSLVVKTSLPARNIAEFWKNLIAENPTLYPFRCMCGLAQKTLGAHNAHIKKCSVLALKAPLFKRIYEMEIYQETEDGRSRRKKKSKRKDDAQALAKQLRQRRAAKQDRKKVSQRIADPNKKVRTRKN